MGNLFSSDKVSDARDKRRTFFKKTPTEQLEAESQLDAPEEPVSTEEQESPVDEQQLEKKKKETGATCGTISEETAAEVQQEVAEEQKIEATTGSSQKLLEFCISVSAAVSDAENKSISEKDEEPKNEPKLIDLFRARRNSKSSWRRFISQGSRMLCNELGELGGAGHFWGDDNFRNRGVMKEEKLKKVLRLLAAGEKKINLKEREFRAFLSEKKRRETQKKFHVWQNWNVAEAGWTIQFKTYWEDGKYCYLWLEQKCKN